jgi:hypothetical protein
VLINTSVLQPGKKRIQSRHEDYNKIMVELNGKETYFSRLGRLL